MASDQRILLTVEGLSPADLVTDRGERARPAEGRSPPVAIDASPRGDAAVAVRAGEAGVDRELVHPAAEAVDPVTLEIVVSLRVVPEGRFGHGSPFFGCVFPGDHIKLFAELQGNRETHEPGI
jgi:hypothetical protein